MRPPAWAFYGFATFWAFVAVLGAGLDNWTAMLTGILLMVILCSFPYVRALVYRQGFRAGYHRGVMGWPPDEAGE